MALAVAVARQHIGRAETADEARFRRFQADPDRIADDTDPETTRALERMRDEMSDRRFHRRMDRELATMKVATAVLTIILLAAAVAAARALFLHH